MEIDFDPGKDDRNRVKHGLSLERFRDLDLRRGLIEVDDRRDYGETRYLVTAPLGKRLHVGCFCEREDEDGVRVFRVISLRKANKREVRIYEQRQQEAADEQGRRREGADR